MDCATLKFARQACEAQIVPSGEEREQSVFIVISAEMRGIDRHPSAVRYPSAKTHLRKRRRIAYNPVNQGQAAHGQIYAEQAPDPRNSGKLQMAEGTIKKLTEKGFGFIDTGKDKDLFFHSSSVQGVSFNDLHEGQRVSFAEARGQKGPCAENVKPV